MNEQSNPTPEATAANSRVSHDALLSEIVDDAFYGRPLLAVTGEEGAGKTALARRFCQQFAGEVECIQLTPADFQHRDRFLATLVSRLGPEAIEYTADSDLITIADYAGSLADQERLLVLLIDDAQLLTPALLETLYELVDEADEASLCCLLLGTPQLRSAIENADPNGGAEDFTWFDMPPQEQPQAAAPMPASSADELVVDEPVFEEPVSEEPALEEPELAETALEEVLEAEQAEQVEELDEVEEVSVLEEVIEAEEVNEVDEVSVLEEIAEAEELDEVSAEEEIAEPEELEEVSAEEEIAEAEELEEVSVEEEAAEAEELEDVSVEEEIAEPEEFEEVSALEAEEEDPEPAESDDFDRDIDSWLEPDDRPKIGGIGSGVDLEFDFDEDSDEDFDRDSDEDTGEEPAPVSASTPAGKASKSRAKKQAGGADVLAAARGMMLGLPSKLAAARAYWVAAAALAIVFIGVLVFWRIPDEPASGRIELAAPLAPSRPLAMREAQPTQPVAVPERVAERAPERMPERATEPPAIMDTQPVPAPLPQQSAVSAPVPAAPAPTAASPVAPPAPTVAATPVPPVRPATAAPPAPAPAVPVDASFESAFLAAPAQSFTLQILTASNEANVRAFVSRYGAGLRQALGYVTTQRSGRPLYVVTYGNFGDRASAEETLRRLPTALAEAGPWVRQIGTLQAEVRAAP
ncbi:MAG: AAA family ATPase [Gammaproteobacteria bacterium]|nr:AAA family ATPase [Gammaproteobacteria bacterium]